MARHLAADRRPLSDGGRAVRNANSCKRGHHKLKTVTMKVLFTLLIVCGICNTVMSQCGSFRIPLVLYYNDQVPYIVRTPVIVSFDSDTSITFNATYSTGSIFVDTLLNMYICKKGTQIKYINLRFLALNTSEIPPLEIVLPFFHSNVDFILLKVYCTDIKSYSRMYMPSRGKNYVYEYTTPGRLWVLPKKE